MIDDLTREMARRMWQKMTDSEKAGVKMGLFPADEMRTAEALGFDGRELSLALMEHEKEESMK